jgi:ribosomal protein S27AE
MSPTFAPPLFGRIFSASKYYSLFQHAVKNHEHKVRHCDDGAFLATPRCQSLETLKKDRVALPSCGPGTLH